MESTDECNLPTHHLSDQETTELPDQSHDGDKGPKEETKTSGDGDERTDSVIEKQRLIVVANRLPITAKRKGKDSWNLEVSVGGLVSALLGITEFETRWIGWAGIDVPDEVGQRSLSEALEEKNCVPVFIDKETFDQYYNGYCNNILWPLFHYLGLPQEDDLSATRNFKSQFDAYKRANHMFADVVTKLYKEGDIVWCHDYHLMFLPKFLKERNREMGVGWFLHTPFPSFEVHQILPSRAELLKAVLAADLVGFHTYDYSRNFVSSCSRVLGLEGTPAGVEDQGKLTRVSVFPIGIDSNRFIRALEDPDVQDSIKELQERFAGRKVVLGVDRLDMIKGIPQKVLAFEQFLEDNPDWQDNVVLLQIAVPSRTDVLKYQKLTCQVHEMVGRINGRFGTLSTAPIHHLDRSIGFNELCALYAITDVALVTSLRDGMNLVSYEFVACQASKKGVLILSEFVGAAQSLGAGAILVNPWNIKEVAEAIHRALTMPDDERELRHRLNFTHVTTHSSQKWAAAFVRELNDTIVEAQLRTRQMSPTLPIDDAIECYTQSNKRLIILGFNATLTEPQNTQEIELKLHPNLKEPLKRLCDDPKTIVIVLSSSDRDALDENFGEYNNMWLAAENGIFLRSTNSHWQTTMPEILHLDWIDNMKLVFEYFTEMTPRSRFELRETSLVWNYKYSDVEFGRLQAKDLMQHLRTGSISNAPVEVIQGSYSVEVRAIGVTKAAAIDRILIEIAYNTDVITPIDYVLCIGHFLSKDEDIYKFFDPELPDTPSAGDERRMTLRKGRVIDLSADNYFSCAAGRNHSCAKYRLDSSTEVVSLLDGLSMNISAE